MRISMLEPHDEDLDFCTCDIEIDASEATPDTDLPAAGGGLESSAEAALGGEEADGCEVGFDGAEGMTDEDLPPSAGGVA
jgi:hypothetical protein